MKTKVLSLTYSVCTIAGLSVGMLDVNGQEATGIAATPNRGTVVIRSINYAGSGCPVGSNTVTAALGDNLNSLQIGFSSPLFAAESSTGHRFSRRNCSVSVDLVYPPGWSYAIVDAQYHGYAGLDAGTHGNNQTGYHFMGMPSTGYLRTYLYGSYHANYTKSATLPENKLVWSSCSEERQLSINTSISVARGSNPSASALITVATDNHKLTVRYGIRWRTC